MQTPITPEEHVHTAAITTPTDQVIPAVSATVIGSTGRSSSELPSMKHYWHEAVYIPDLADAPKAWSVAQRMVELRGDDLAGGFVVRRYEAFTGAEARTWWINGACRLVTAHPDTPDELPPADLDVTVLRLAVTALALPFVTVDLARRTDGTWRIIELGDGQVSDRPASTPPADLINTLPRD
jgi:ATP-grasp domain-containing protein